MGLDEAGERAAGNPLSVSAADQRSIKRRVPLTDVDRTVAARIRARRESIGLLQKDMARDLRMRRREYIDYEVAKTWISAARLYDIARLLHVPVDYFFETLSTDPLRPVSHQEQVLLDLVSDFAEIDDPSTQKVIVDLARALSAHKR